MSATIRVGGQVYTVAVSLEKSKTGRLVKFRSLHPNAEAIERYAMGHREAASVHIDTCPTCSRAAVRADIN